MNIAIRRSPDRRLAGLIVGKLTGGGAVHSIGSEDLRLALQAVFAARRITMRHFAEIRLRGRGGRVFEKSDGSPVTNADREAELAIRALIEKAHPGDGFLGEEFGEKLGSDAKRDVRWVADPVDGTTSFSHGFPNWAIMLAKQTAKSGADGTVKYRTDISVILMPAIQTMWLAVRGHGAWRVAWSGDIEKGGADIAVERMHVGTSTDVAGAVVSTSSLRSLKVEGRAQTLEAILSSAEYVRENGNALSHMLVAEGRAAAAFGSNLSPTYDVIPIMHIIEEAGGTSSPIPGLENRPPGGGDTRVTLLSANSLLFGKLRNQAMPGEQAINGAQLG
jgi:histidinol-phosphatase